MKQRVAVIRLDTGQLLTRDGQRTYDPMAAIQFRYKDASRFLSELQLKGLDRWSDRLHGASIEVLSKRRGRWLPLSEGEFEEFLAMMKLVRLEQEALKFDRLAKGYDAQAKHANEMAAKMRAQAESIRGRTSA